MMPDIHLSWPSTSRYFARKIRDFHPFSRLRAFRSGQGLSETACLIFYDEIVSEGKERTSLRGTLFALLALRRLNHRYFLTALHAVHARANRFSSSCRCLFIFRLLTMITIARPEDDDEHDIKAIVERFLRFLKLITHKPRREAQEDSQSSRKQYKILMLQSQILKYIT